MDILQRLIRRRFLRSVVVSLWLACALAAGIPAHGAAEVTTETDRAELLSWSDPDAALALLDQVQPTLRTDEARVQFLTVRGFAFIDSRQDRGAAETIQRLQAMARGAVASAGPAVHFVRAYLLCQSDQFNAARAELDAVDPGKLPSLRDQYRLQLLRATVLRFFGRHEEALFAYERAIDIANAMPSTMHALHALIKSTQFFVRMENFDRAESQLAQARQLAERIGDEAALVRIELDHSDMNDRRGDHREAVRRGLEALRHAKKVGSARLFGLVYQSLGDAYFNAGQFAESLKYSKRALTYVPLLRLNGFEINVLFNIGRADIALGRLAEGKRIAESAIQQALDSGNQIDADGLMQEYGHALENAGDWRAAVEMHRRNDKLREEMMTASRQRALLELSAKFEAERNAREIELLRRDNAVKSAELRVQRLHQQLIGLIAVLIGGVCVALVWAFSRVSKVNARLRYNSEHDALTSLPNRRYFQERVLIEQGDRPFTGCVLIVDVDHFKRINDAFGHAAGDLVLSQIGRRLAAVLRGEDTLVRWGGEEFLAVLGPMTNAQLGSTARRLLNAVRQEPFWWQSRGIHCTISIGHAGFPLPGTTTNISLSRAISLVDKALYQAKRRGRDRACLISVLRAESEQDLATINAEFDAATADQRVQLEEITGITAKAG